MRAYTYALVCICMQAAYLCKNTRIFALLVLSFEFYQKRFICVTSFVNTPSINCRCNSYTKLSISGRMLIFIGWWYGGSRHDNKQYNIIFCLCFIIIRYNGLWFVWGVMSEPVLFVLIWLGVCLLCNIVKIFNCQLFRGVALYQVSVGAGSDRAISRWLGRNNTIVEIQRLRLKLGSLARNL